jgi:hypothetical protein
MLSMPLLILGGLIYLVVYGDTGRSELAACCAWRGGLYHSPQLADFADLDTGSDFLTR